MMVRKFNAEDTEVHGGRGGGIDIRGLDFKRSDCQVDGYIGFFKAVFQFAGSLNKALKQNIVVPSASSVLFCAPIHGLPC